MQKAIHLFSFSGTTSYLQWLILELNEQLAHSSSVGTFSVDSLTGIDELRHTLPSLQVLGFRHKLLLNDMLLASIGIFLSL